MILEVPSRDEFVRTFLIPVSKINNSCVLNLSDQGMSTLLASADNTVILYSQYKTQFNLAANTKINLPDIGRLSKILACIPVDAIELSINENHIEYKSKDIRFKYHLLDDGILTTPSISVEKIKGLTYNTTFELPFTSIISLIKSSSFTLDLNKVYIFTKESSVYAEINDKTSHNVDSICLKICDSYEGSPIDEPLPVSFDTIRTLAGSSAPQINTFINSELNVMTFEVNNNNIKNTYIVSGLVK